MPRTRAAFAGLTLLLVSVGLRDAAISFASCLRPKTSGNAGFVGFSALEQGRHRPRPVVKATSLASPQDEKSSAAAAAAGLLGGGAFWTFCYWLFFKAIAHITVAVQARPNLEVLSFCLLSLVPFTLVQRGAVKWGVDKPLETLARVMPTAGLRHIVRSAVPGMHNAMTALLLFFAVNLLTSAVPEHWSIELPEKLKALDPDGNGILTGPELESVVQTFSVKLLTVLFYFEAGLYGLVAVQKPRDYEASGKDVIDRYWRNLDKRQPKAVVLFLFLYGIILFSTVSGILRALGLSARSILALGGVSGLAFGLAAQNLVGNFMSGILLIVNRQFTVGDVIETNGVEGKVRAMGWTFIEMESGENLVMLPNSQVVGSTVVQIGHFAKGKGADSADSVDSE